MPLKLVSPSPGRSPFYRVRGTHLGVYVDQSTRSGDKRFASQFLVAIKGQIERGELQDRSAPAPMTFAAAAITYMELEGDKRFLAPILHQIGDAPVASITQAMIDRLAVALYPNATNATRNRQVYTPISAVLRRAEVPFVLRRPKGAQGTPRRIFLSEEQAFAVLDAAAKDQHFEALLTFLTYCGVRKREALELTWDRLDIDRATATLSVTKNGEPQTAHLPPVVVAALRVLPPAKDGRGRPTETVFGFANGKRLDRHLHDAFVVAGVARPKGVAFHLFRHTFGAWMKRRGLDTSAMVATGRWKSAAAARVYEHLDVTDAARRADELPTRAKAVQLREVK